LALRCSWFLETLKPTERIAFVLHDMFAEPFDEIATIVGCSPLAARQLASRARRRIQGAAIPDADLSRQRRVVDAFLAAARGGDFESLLAMLDPDVLLCTDRGPQASREIRGAPAVAQQAQTFSRLVETVQPVLVNGTAGIVSWLRDGRPFSVMGFTIKSGRIVEIDVLDDAVRLRRLNLGVLNR
jgi:ketosteroid isomerase-like protein